MTKKKPDMPLPPPAPRCEVHDGDAPGEVKTEWNGKLRWVCRVCLAGR